jgi:flagellar protein FliO/FliZ
MGVLDYLRFVGALGVVLALILGGMLLLRRFGLPGMVARAPGRRRLKLVEVLSLDPKRRLILVRRDGREHLLLLGGATDLVVERDIPPGEGQGTGGEA